MLMPRALLFALAAPVAAVLGRRYGAGHAVLLGVTIAWTIVTFVWLISHPALVPWSAEEPAPRP